MSYRQVGKLPTGRIRSSKVAGQHNGQRAFSSIPSKFETTLFTGNRERDGFGSSAHRFSEVENELPGPGSYNADSAAAALVDTMVFSKKGYGSGFVSKTKRQSAFAKAAASTPAPTAYGYGSAGTFDAAARANRFGASTSAFQPENAACFERRTKRIDSFLPAAELKRLRLAQPLHAVKHPRSDPRIIRPSILPIFSRFAFGFIGASVKSTGCSAGSTRSSL